MRKFSKSIVHFLSIIKIKLSDLHVLKSTLNEMPKPNKIIIIINLFDHFNGLNTIACFQYSMT